LGAESFFLGVKRPGSEADHSDLSSAKVKNGGAIPLIPHTSSWLGAYLIEHKDKFTPFILSSTAAVLSILHHASHQFYLTKILKQKTKLLASQ
jgi:hypothetical protein